MDSLILKRKRTADDKVVKGTRTKRQKVEKLQKFEQGGPTEQSLKKKSRTTKRKRAGKGQEVVGANTKRRKVGQSLPEVGGSQDTNAVLIRAENVSRKQKKHKKHEDSARTHETTKTEGRTPMPSETCSESKIVKNEEKVEDNTKEIYEKDQESKHKSLLVSEGIVPLKWCNLNMGGTLGFGMYGAIRKGTLTLSGGVVVDVAIKQPTNDVKTEDFIHEAKMMQMVDGLAGVPRLYGVTEDSPLAMVMEFCPGTTLLMFLKKEFDLSHLQVFIQVAEAILQLHEGGYVHRDLHFQNIMVNRPFPWELEVRLIDLGFCSPLTGKDDTDKANIEEDYKPILRLAFLLSKKLGDDAKTQQLKHESGWPSFSHGNPHTLIQLVEDIIQERYGGLS